MKDTLAKTLKTPPPPARKAKRAGLPYHTSYRGTTRKGKTVAMLRDQVFKSLLAEDRLTVVIDPAFEFGMEAAVLARRLGYAPEDIWINNLDDFHHVVPIELIGVSDHPDPLIRSALCRRFRQEFVSLIGWATNTEDIQTLQTVKFCLNLIGLVYQYQRERMDQRDIVTILMPGTAQFQVWKAGCASKRALMQLGMIEALWQSNKGEYYKMVMPTIRRLEELMDDDAIAVRLSGNKPDIEPLLERGGLIVHLCTQGGPVSEVAQTILLRDANLEIGRLARRRKALKNVLTRCDVHFDEWRAVNGVQAPEIVNLNTLLKLQTRWCYSTQNDDLGDPQMNDDFQQAFAEQYTFYCASQSVRQRAAESMITAVNLYKVKRVRERKRNVVVDHERIDTTTKGKSRDHEGNERIDERSGVIYRPIYEEVTDLEDEYFPVSEQLTDLQIKIAQLGVGEYMLVKDGATSGPHYEPMPRPPFGSKEIGQEYFDEQYRWLIDNCILQSTSALPGVSYEPSTQTDPVHRRSRKKKSSN